MSHTNSTTNYQLPQFVGTDTPGWLTDVNGAMADIDAAIYARQQAVATNSNDIASLSSRMSTAESDLSVAESDIETLEGSVNTLNTTVGDQGVAISNNTSNISALNTTVSDIQSKVPVQTAVTMAAASWNASDEYEFADASITANSIITLGVAVGCTAAEMAAFNAASLRPVSVTAGTGFTVHADGDVPNIDIPVVIVREG